MVTVVTLYGIYPQHFQISEGNLYDNIEIYLEISLKYVYTYILLRYAQCGRDREHTFTQKIYASRPCTEKGRQATR